MKLTVIHRQGNGEFVEFWNRSRGGTSTEFDINLINATCSETRIIHKEGIEGWSRFKCVNVLKILMTNQLWIEHSMKSL